MFAIDSGAVGGGKKTTTTTKTTTKTTTPAKTTTVNAGVGASAAKKTTTTTYKAPTSSQQYKEAQQEKFLQNSVNAGKVVNNTTAKALGYNNYQDYLQTQKLRAQGLNESNNWGQPTSPAKKSPSPSNDSPRQIIEELSTDGYYNQLLDYFKDKNEEARNSAIAAIMQRLNTLKGMYGTQMEDLDEEYQKLINQNEVQRYKSKGAIREALANRGQLDSGLGRQEQLYLDTKYGNQTSNLKAQKQKAKQDIQNLINQAIAEAEADKAETNNAYNNALLQYELANA